MDSIDAATSILARIDVAYSGLTTHIGTASFISLSSVVMDIWAMSALRSLRVRDGKATPTADQYFDRTIVFINRTLVIFAAAFVFVVGTAALLGSHSPFDPKTAREIAGLVAVAVALLLWFGLPPLQRWLSDRARLLIEARVPYAGINRVLLGFLKFDPANPGVLSGLFYVKLMIIDVLLLMYMIGKWASLLLTFPGVRGT